MSAIDACAFAALMCLKRHGGFRRDDARMQPILVAYATRVADGERVVNHHRGADAPLAMRAAFDAMDRCLDERERIRRGDVEQHGSPL
jgi:hypothetical protein